MITVPHEFTPRPYQLPLLKALDSGFKRIIQVWHRRSGKDKVDFNYVIKEAARVKANYYYFAPTYSQGKKIIWDNIDNSGFKMLDHIPKALRKRVDNSNMLIELTNGSIIQVIGTDNIDSIVGTNPRICVFTEYSLQDPRAWQYIRPILAANGGIAIFNFTPRGENHAYDLLRFAELHPEQWYVSKLGVTETKVLSDEILSQEREEMLSQTGDDALYQQEYMISFNAPVQGAYYGAHITKAEEDGRIGTVPYEEGLKVNTYWDLGVDDSMTIWFVQTVGKEIRIIDYLENSGEGMTFYIRELQQKGYVYGEHYAPHDIRVRELTSGKSRLETARTLGIDFRIAPQLGIEDGIDAARRIFGRIWFDKVKCERGIAALKSYQKEFDEKNKVYKNHPLHNWASHGADAFRYFAVSYEEIVDTDPLPDDTVAFQGWY